MLLTSLHKVDGGVVDGLLVFVKLGKEDGVVDFLVSHRHRKNEVGDGSDFDYVVKRHPVVQQWLKDEHHCREYRQHQPVLQPALLGRDVLALDGLKRLVACRREI